MVESIRFILNGFAASFRGMSWKQHLIYWILPLIIICSLAFGYFAGPRWLQNIIATPVNREFGLQEDLEHLILIAIVILSLRIFLLQKQTFLKLVYLVSFFGSAFLFLEEIDYGYHYINYFRGIDPGQDPVIHNIHNREKHTINNMMKVCYLILGFFFVTLPYIKKEKLPGWLQQLTPSRCLQFTVLALPIIGRFPLFLNTLNFTPNGSLHDNLSEFEELGIYYIFLIYFVEMFNKCRTIPPKRYHKMVAVKGQRVQQSPERTESKEINF